jgi:pimeloyl-ACP methyl ester carboxylesterase
MSTVERTGATIVYDVRPPVTDAVDLPPLVLVGHPMTAEGFRSLAASLPERTIVTLDPRGTGRSTAGAGPAGPEDHADDVQAVIRAATGGQADVFGSSGGAITVLALASRHPEAVRAAVAHEPPLVDVLPDRDLVNRASARVSETYRTHGFGAGMVEFITMTSWKGPLTQDYFEQPRPTPAQFGLPEQDDGSRDDPLLSGPSDAAAAFTPDWAALRALGPRLAIAAGRESRDLLTWRTSEIVAQRCGGELVVFPSHHGGFLGGEFGQQGQPEAFAVALRDTFARILVALSG